MSFLGFDLLDGAPTVGFLSGDISDEVSGGEAEDNSSLHQRPAQLLPDWENDAVSSAPSNGEITIVFEAASEQGEDSSFIIDGVSIEAREEEGVTILSSAPSSLASSFSTSHGTNGHVLATSSDTPRSIVHDTPPPQILAMSPQPQVSTESALSLSTAESMFTMMNHTSLPSTRNSSSISSEGEGSLGSTSSVSSRLGIASARSSFLSLSPSSLPSSVVTNTSLSNGTQLSGMTARPIRSLPDELGWLSLSSLAPSPAAVPPQAIQSDSNNSELAILSRSTAQPHQDDSDSSSSPAWYEDLATEQDWQLFRDQALQILAAMGGGDGLDGIHNNISADELLALLIEQEEEFWAAAAADASNQSWNNQTQASQQSLSRVQQQQLWPPTSSGWKFVGEAALVLAAAAAAPMVVLPLVRRHVLASN